MVGVWFTHGGGLCTSHTQDVTLKMAINGGDKDIAVKLSVGS